ncbi:hypothetical protein [Actinopolymorpha singaporensis]|uniref:Uncharacterized protein n=1 Tax=Actinopolymorpha singaporensis TaxID=117157 RepID=A0A1H1MGV4_9ACTN|nr:hypothetical protein [Actinopolymorpha singaporensis]SDR85870.1 hypothetical protein SAMN04489717_0815 [Actinopolymorpha singaporensis]
MKRFGRVAGVAAFAVVASGMAVSSATAAPPTTQTSFQAGLQCSGTTTTGEQVFVTAGASSDFGDFAYVAVGPDEAPVLSGYGTGSWNDGAPAYPLDVYDAEGEPVGSGAFTATTTVTAQVETDGRNDNGNQHVKSHTVASTLAVRPTLDLPRYTIQSLDCTGTSTLVTYRANSPAATMRSQRQLFDSARCEGNAVVGLFGPAEGEYYLSVEVEHEGRQYNLFGPVEPAEEFVATLPLRDSETAEVVADIPVTVTARPTGETTTGVLRTSKARVVQKATPYAVNAQAELPWGSVDATCEHLEILTREHISASQGPKPGGPAPSNDTLATASTLTAGSTVRDSSRGAAEEAEADLPCADGPVGRTLWYAVQGTGGTLHLDTARSDFDTVLAVYTATADGLEPVACGDDDGPGFPLPRTTLQARVDLPTSAGTTYYVQVGGLYGDYGRLALTATAG